MSIRISDNLVLPEDAVTQTFAFLARRGAGKSYGAMKLAEGMLDVNAQIVAIDPVGVWYSLRIGSDGKSKGYDLPILGGLHGDIPLEPGAGALIADLIVERGISAVLDVSMFRKNERKQFATAFAEQLFHRKKQHRSPLHVFVEEAQVFVPQRAMGDEARMLGAFEDLVKLGRNFGIGVTLISQRPQSVNKDALNQTEALFVLQTNGAQERKALESWIVEQGVTTKGIVDALPSLPIGTAYLWSPSWLHKLEKVKIGKRKTYNASATPTVGQERAEPRPLSKDELAEVEQAMSATIAKAKADDPKELRRQIADLQRQVNAPPVRVEKEIERVEVPVITADQMENLRMLADHWARTMEAALSAFSKAVSPSLEAFNSALEESARRVASGSAGMARVMNRAPVRARERIGHEGTLVPKVPVSPASAGDLRLGKAERAILSALAQNPDGCEKAQLGILSGYSPNSGGFNNTLSKLRSAGFINRESPIGITDAGLEALGGYDPLPTGEELLNYWTRRLGKCEAAILLVLAEEYPGTLDKTRIGEKAGYSSTSGGFNNALSKLRTLKLIEGYGEIKASDAFF